MGRARRRLSTGPALAGGLLVYPDWCSRGMCCGCPEEGVKEVVGWGPTVEKRAWGLDDTVVSIRGDAGAPVTFSS